MAQFPEKISLLNKIPVRLIDTPYCSKCMGEVNDNQDLCENCSELSFVDQFYFEKVVAIGKYGTANKHIDEKKIPFNITSRIILKLKDKEKTSGKKIGKYVADGLYQMIQFYPFLCPLDSYLVIPPKYDLNEFNQCRFFLEPLLKMLEKEGLEVLDLSNEVIKIKDTGENKTKNFPQRFEDIEGSHKCKLANLNLQNVLILDDIFTSGSTVNDIAKCLKAKNAGEINILCIGRNYTAQSISGFTFEELLIYFSLIDTIIEFRKINDVVIESYELGENSIDAKLRKYTITIDFEKKVLTHDCGDFKQRRKNKKSFCKHISKLFIEIKEDYEESKSKELLTKIYEDILDWSFISE